MIDFVWKSHLDRGNAPFSHACVRRSEDIFSVLKFYFYILSKIRRLRAPLCESIKGPSNLPSLATILQVSEFDISPSELSPLLTLSPVTRCLGSTEFGSQQRHQKTTTWSEFAVQMITFSEVASPKALLQETFVANDLFLLDMRCFMLPCEPHTWTWFISVDP